MSDKLEQTIGFRHSPCFDIKGSVVLDIDPRNGELPLAGPTPARWRQITLIELYLGALTPPPSPLADMPAARCPAYA